MTLVNRRVLFISYNGMLDPLGQSQVIPYLKELSRKGLCPTLLSFERSRAYTRAGIEECKVLERELASDGIDWHWLRYHKAPSLPATIYDVAAGIIYGRQLVWRNQIELVHARSHIPAAIALGLKQRSRLKMIFDVRGLMADEYVDAGHWQKGSVSYRLTKAAERRALAAADGIVTLTERIWPIIREWHGLRDRQLAHEVVPCCADLEVFKFSEADRARRREELRLGDRFVLVYSGSIDGWYLTEKMADFFAWLKKLKPNAHFLWLTPERHGRINSLMQARRFGKNDYTVLGATPRNVPSFLSAGDAGLAFIKPCFSKLASSPTKYAEYLACGLPLIINTGIGDSDALITQERVGALVKDFTEVEYSNAAAVIDELVNSFAQTRQRTREVAERLFDVRRVGVSRYARLYEHVLAGTN